jgi:hypothetical protein
MGPGNQLEIAEFRARFARSRTRRNKNHAPEQIKSPDDSCGA